MGGFRPVSAQRYAIAREEPIYMPGRAAIHEAERLQWEADYMIRELTRQANGATETFFFAGTEKHMQWLRERKPFEFRGNFGGWVGCGVPLSEEPDTPFLPDATHEARILFPAGTMPLQARGFTLNGNTMWVLKTGHTLYAEGVIVKDIRELHPAGKK